MEQRTEGLVNIREAGRILGRSLDWMQRKSETFGVPGYRVGNRRMYKPSELEAWIEARKIGGSE